MKRAKLVLPLLALALPLSAQAQSVTGQVTLGFGSQSWNDSNWDSSDYAVAANALITFESGWSLDLKAMRQSLKTEGDDELDHFFAGDVTLSYTLANGVRIGGYLEYMADLEHTEAWVDDSTLTGGIEIGYRIAGVDLTATRTIGSDVESQSLSALYEVNGLTLAATAATSKSYWIDATYVGVAAAYQINSDFSVFASAARQSEKEIYDWSDEYEFTEVSLGASYSFEAAGRPLVASLEVSQFNSEGGSWDETERTGYMLSLTMPIGKVSSVVPKTGAAGMVFDPRKSALNDDSH